MSSKYLYIGLAVISVGLIMVAVVFRAPEAPRPGSEHDDYGRGHVATKDYGDVEPPTSGEHGETIKWGIYKEEVNDANVLHNIEHGGIYISYRPDVSDEEVAKIEGLYSVPSSVDKFTKPAA